MVGSREATLSSRSMFVKAVVETLDISGTVQHVTFDGKAIGG
jgi:hypothetical protein